MITTQLNSFYPSLPLGTTRADDLLAALQEVTQNSKKFISINEQTKAITTTDQFKFASRLSDINTVVSNLLKLHSFSTAQLKKLDESYPYFLDLQPLFNWSTLGLHNNLKKEEGQLVCRTLKKEFHTSKMQLIQKLRDLWKLNDPFIHITISTLTTAELEFLELLSQCFPRIKPDRMKEDYPTFYATTKSLINRIIQRKFKDWTIEACKHEWDRALKSTSTTLFATQFKLEAVFALDPPFIEKLNKLDKKKLTFIDKVLDEAIKCQTKKLRNNRDYHLTILKSLIVQMLEAPSTFSLEEGEKALTMALEKIASYPHKPKRVQFTEVTTTLQFNALMPNEPLDRKREILSPLADEKSAVERYKKTMHQSTQQITLKKLREVDGDRLTIFLIKRGFESAFRSKFNVPNLTKNKAIESAKKSLIEILGQFFEQTLKEITTEKVQPRKWKAETATTEVKKELQDYMTSNMNQILSRANALTYFNEETLKKTWLDILNQLFDDQNQNDLPLILNNFFSRFASPVETQ